MHFQPLGDTALLLRGVGPTKACPISPFVTALRRTATRIAVVNDKLPFDRQGHHVALCDFTHAAECSTPILHLPEPETDAATDRIAFHVAQLVPDGATIQTGIGKIPGQILRALCAHRRLRIRSGILLPAVRTLAECGALDPAPRIVGASAAGDGDQARSEEQ